MNKKRIEMPKFKSVSEEADWWASQPGRDYVKRKSADARSKGIKAKGSTLVARLNRKSSVQIALRLPEADIENDFALSPFHSPSRASLLPFWQ